MTRHTCEPDLYCGNRVSDAEGAHFNTFRLTAQFACRGRDIPSKANFWRSK